MSDGTVAVAAPNLGMAKKKIVICFSELGIASGTSVDVRL
jgi:hypothetical protein